MDARRRPDDPLAQRTRAHLFELLAELGRPAATGELARVLALHPNGVRTHLGALERAGLVARRRARRPRGRPRDEWSIAPGAEPASEPGRAYADLARWLARAVAGSPEALAAIERAGREVGRELAPAAPGGADWEDRLGQALAALGFRPSLERPDPGRARCTLRSCPYRDAVRGSGRAVCTLHRGLTAGLLETLEPGARLTRFEPHDPDEAGCVVEAEAGGGPADAAAP